MKTRLFILVVGLSLLAAPDAGAQHEYARTAGDTLEYRETTNVFVTVNTPQGAIDVDVRFDGVLQLTFETPDTARAWFTSLNVSSSSPMGAQRPATTAVINQPFTLHFGPQGQVESLVVPSVPPELRMLSDVRRQFDDYFLILPDEPLSEGMSWEYDRSVSDDGEGGDSYAITKRGTMTVSGDTLIDGRQALLIEGDLMSTLDVRMTDPNQGVRVTNAFSGLERNRIVFEPVQGTMLVRERTANLSGVSQYEGGPVPMTMDQQVRYDSVIRLQP